MNSVRQVVHDWARLEALFLKPEFGSLQQVVLELTSLFLTRATAFHAMDEKEAWLKNSIAEVDRLLRLELPRLDNLGKLKLVSEGRRYTLSSPVGP